MRVLIGGDDLGDVAFLVAGDDTWMAAGLLAKLKALEMM